MSPSPHDLPEDDALVLKMQELLDGELSDEEAADVRARVAASELHAKLFEGLTTITEAAKSVPAAPVENGYVDAILARIAQADVKRHVRRRKFRGLSRHARRSPVAWGAVAALAAAAVIAIAVLAPRSTPARRDESVARRPAPTPVVEPAPEQPLPEAHDVVVAVRETPAPAPQPAPPAAEPAVEPEPEPVLPREEAVADSRPEPVSPAPAAPAPAAKRAFIAYVDRLEGHVEAAHAASTEWQPLTAGLGITQGDKIRTKFSRARLVFESASVLHVNRFTTLSMGTGVTPPTLSVVGGEIYVEATKADRGFSVETPHGRVVDLGTRFGINVKQPGTTVIVVEGSVDASTDAGSTRVKERQEVLLARRALPPGKVRAAANIRKRLAWAIGDSHDAVPGLIALYTFHEGVGTIVHDVSGSKRPVDMVIETPQDVQWLRPRGIRIAAPSMIAAHAASPHVVAACQKTNEITMEAWVTPSRLSDIAARIGPDRFITMSGDSGARNFTLGQGEMRSHPGCYAGRLRTIAGKKEASNGLPAVVTKGIVRPGVGPDHVVYTRSASGEAALWVNGVKQSSRKIEGTFATWNPDYRMAIASEFGARQVRGGKRIDERSFLGDIYLIALYSRALSDAEIIKAYKSGPTR